jgi:flagellin
MAINDVSLTSGMRNNLLALQNTVTLLDRTQNRLSTGKKVNTAIDNPVSYFAAAALNARAASIDSLKDAMGQSIQTITAADKGISAITTMIEQAKGIAQSAQSAAAGATSTLDGTAASTYGNVTIDFAGYTAHVNGAISFQLTGVSSAQTIGIGGQTFTYTDSGAANTFTSATGLATLISAIAGYSASASAAGVTAGTITVTHSTGAIVTGDVSGNITLTAATNVSTYVAGDSITLTGGTILTAGIDFTSTTTLVTALSTAGYGGSSATGNTVTVGKAAATVLLADVVGSGLTVAQGANEVRSYTVGASTFAYTAGTDFVAGSTTAGTTVAGLLGTAVGDAGLGIATVSNATVTLVAASSELTSLQTQFNNLLTQLDALATDSGYKGKNLLKSDVMTVKFEGVNLTVTGFSATASGLEVAQSNTGSTMWTKGSTFIEATITQLESAATKLSSESSKLSGNLSIITVRQDFSTNMINTLNSGSDKLTLADANEEGANMLMLQTRQSLSTTALSLSAQAAQSVLKLFG